MTTFDSHRAFDDFADKDCGRGAGSHEVTGTERALGVILPEGYKAFLRRYGWARLSYQELYGIGVDVPQHLDLVKNTLAERHQMRPPLPPQLIPIMNDGAGNHYCLDTDRITNGDCPVVFWDHEKRQDQQPGAVAATFEQWLLSLLNELNEVRD